MFLKNIYGPSYAQFCWAVKPWAPGLGLAEPSGPTEPQRALTGTGGSPHPHFNHEGNSSRDTGPHHPGRRKPSASGLDVRGLAGPGFAGNTRRGAHPSPGTSRSLRPRARSCPARPPPLPGAGPGAAGGWRGRRPFLAAGRALAACLRDIPGGRHSHTAASRDRAPPSRDRAGHVTARAPGWSERRRRR